MNVETGNKASQFPGNICFEFSVYSTCFKSLNFYLQFLKVVQNSKSLNRKIPLIPDSSEDALQGMCLLFAGALFFPLLNHFSHQCLLWIRCKTKDKNFDSITITSKKKTSKNFEAIRPQEGLKNGKT